MNLQAKLTAAKITFQSSLYHRFDKQFNKRSCQPFYRNMLEGNRKVFDRETEFIIEWKIIGVVFDFIDSSIYNPPIAIEPLSVHESNPTWRWAISNDILNMP